MRCVAVSLSLSVLQHDSDDRSSFADMPRCELPRALKLYGQRAPQAVQYVTEFGHVGSVSGRCQGPCLS